MSDMYKDFDDSKLDIIIQSAHTLNNWYESKYGRSVKDYLDPSIRDKVIYSVALLWVNDKNVQNKEEISRLKSEAEKWERIAMLAWEEKHRAVDEVGRLRGALESTRSQISSDLECAMECSKEYEDNEAIHNDGFFAAENMRVLYREIIRCRQIADKALDTSE